MWMPGNQDNGMSGSSFEHTFGLIYSEFADIGHSDDMEQN
jgi:hypothetical protein